MTYTITVRLVNDSFETINLVEMTGWHYARGATWEYKGLGEYMVTMPGSGTSGMLRFKSSNGELFAVAVGVHNYKRWTDIRTNLNSDDTLAKIHQEYYGSNQSIWRQDEKATALTSTGKVVSLQYYVTEGDDLRANLTYKAGICPG